MAAVEWVFPDGIDEALRALSVPGSVAVAGGTTVLDLMKLGFPTAARLVDLSRLDLYAIKDLPNAMLLGALATNSAVARSQSVRVRFPALTEAILLGASEQIRNAATVGGNLMQATRCSYYRAPDWACNRRHPGSGCPAKEVPMAGHAVLGASDQCIATHPSDMAVALLALDAEVIWHGPEGPGRIPVARFYRLPGDQPDLETRLPQGALITAIEIPHSRAAQISGYLKLRGRASYEFATASVAVALDIDAGVVRRVAVALGGLGTIPWRDLQAERPLIGQPLTRNAIDDLADRLLDGADARKVTLHKVGLARGAIHRMFERLAGT